MTPPLRLAVVGGGHLGRIHAKLIRTIPHTELVGIVEPVAAVRRELSKDLSVRTYSSLDGLLVDGVDGAVLASPAQTHFELGHQLLQRGIGTFIEKPLATKAKHAQRMVQIAARQNAVLQVGHVERFNPAFQVACQKMPHPRMVRAVRTGTYTFRSTDIGVIFDLMIHDLELLLRWIPHPVERLDAIGFSVFGTLDDVAHVNLWFADGCVANLFASRVACQGRRTLEAFAPGISANIDFAAQQVHFMQPGEPLLSGRLAANDLSPDERALWQNQLFQHVLPVETCQPAKRNQILEELHNFAAALRGTESPQVSGEQGAKAVELAERICRRMVIHPWSEPIHQARAA